MSDRTTRQVIFGAMVLMILLVMGLMTPGDSTAQQTTRLFGTTSTGTAAPVPVDNYGALSTRIVHPNHFRCLVTVSIATTIQAVGGSCATPGAGLSLYITDVEFGTSAAAGTAADSFPTLKSGTGGTCGTATAVVWQALTVANSTASSHYLQPIKLTAAHELCWIMTTAGSKTLQVQGFIAP